MKQAAGVEPELRITATNVAQQLMDEIMTKCWDESAATAANCGGTVSYSTLGYDPASVPAEVLNNLTTYDDVDDYELRGVCCNCWRSLLFKKRGGMLCAGLLATTSLLPLVTHSWAQEQIINA